MPIATAARPCPPYDDLASNSARTRTGSSSSRSLSNFTGCKWRPLVCTAMILLRPDRVGHRRALERRADVEAPQFLQRLVVIGDHPAVLQRGEYDAAGGDQRAGAHLDVGDDLGEDLVIDRVVGGDRAVVEVAGVGPLLASSAGRDRPPDLEDTCRAVLGEAALGADAIGDLLYRVVSRGLVGDAAVPSRAGALRAVAAQRARRRNVFLDVELRDRIRPACRSWDRAPWSSSARSRIGSPLMKLPLVRSSVVVEAVAAEMANDFAHHAVDRDVVEHVDAVLVVVPRLVRDVLEVPASLPVSMSMATAELV